MIRRLQRQNAEAFAELRREALRDAPLAFASSPDDDLVSDPAAVLEHLERGPESVIFGAFRDDLIGCIGVYRDRHLKASHKVHVWGMYVRPSHRREGIGTGLLRAAVEHAASQTGVSWVHLTVSVAAPAARRLYEAAGFRVWGTEPEALRHEGRTVSELHMALKLASDEA